MTRRSRSRIGAGPAVLEQRRAEQVAALTGPQTVELAQRAGVVVSAELPARIALARWHARQEDGR